MKKESITTYLNHIRKPERNLPLNRKIFITMGIFCLGFAFGIFQKWMEGGEFSGELGVLSQLDFANYFGRLAIYMLLGTAISVYSKSPLRAGVNTSFFLLATVAGYYFYTNYVLGFLPVSYMMIWLAVAGLSFFIAPVCWYAKGKGMVGIVLSAILLGSLFSQAFLMTQGFYVTHPLEVITWMVGLIILSRRPKEMAMEVGLSIGFALLYQLIFPYFG